VSQYFGKNIRAGVDTRVLNTYLLRFATPKDEEGKKDQGEVTDREIDYVYCGGKQENLLL
jgi:hypothetical protein